MIREKKNATCALRSLASNNQENQNAIIQAGAIDHHVNQLLSEDLDEHETAALALVSLVRNNQENSNVIKVAHAAIPLLTNLLRFDHYRIQQSAVRALRNLAKNEIVKHAIIIHIDSIEGLKEFIHTEHVDLHNVLFSE